MPVDVLDRHGRFVDQDTDRQRQPAQGHDVERLAHGHRVDDRAEDGKRNRGRDDSVDRQLPRNSRIIRLVSAAAIAPSRTTPAIAALTKTD